MQVLHQWETLGSEGRSQRGSRIWGRGRKTVGYEGEGGMGRELVGSFLPDSCILWFVISQAL